MKKKIRFKSVTRDGIAYIWSNIYDSNMSRYDRFNYFHPFVCEYQTYNDRTIQHSPKCPVSKDYFVDCLVSLYIYLTEKPDNITNSDIGIVEDNWPQDYRPTEDQMKFVATLKYNPDKIQYVNFWEMKVTKSKSKEYGTRWEKLPEYVNGSFEGQIRYLSEQVRGWGALENFHTYYMMRNYISNHFYYPTHIKGFNIGVEIKEEDQEYLVFQHYEYSYKAIHCLVTSYRMKLQAGRVFYCLKHNWLDKQTA